MKKKQKSKIFSQFLGKTKYILQILLKILSTSV